MATRRCNPKYCEKMVHFPFDNTYAKMPERFFAKVSPTPVANPKLVRVNRELAVELGLDPDELSSDEGLQILAGNKLPERADAIATAYAGHQFGGFVPQLGDGRAILLGEVIDKSGRRRDIQLKGPGRTPFSRGGDGRAAVGPVLREYIVSEAMFALGIPTTRALAAVTTGELVMRETPLPGAIITRVASSHLRVGTFQFFAARRDVEGLRLLADHVIARHYPAIAGSAHPYHALLNEVIEAQAKLVASWLLVGFIHGVMNTDNVSVAGETIDYGPCAFMDEYNPEAVFSAIDTFGRYAYYRQPEIAEWNLARLAECLLPLFGPDSDAAIAHATEALQAFAPIFNSAYQGGLRQKLGLTREREGDNELARDLLNAMVANQADFTLTFRRLADALDGPEGDDGAASLFNHPDDFTEWAVRWRERLAEEEVPTAERRRALLAINPAYIPRNHRVEAVIRAAVDREDFGPFEELLTALSRPFEDQPGFEHYMEPPKEEERVLRTFCGT